jgi:thiosulfate/3-mercaptopyruvate sulfurtransferase
MEKEILVTPSELAQLSTESKESLIIIDTRDPEEYAKEHIPGAVNLRDFFTYLATSDEAGCKAFRDHFSGLLGAAGVESDSYVVIYEDKMNNGFGQSCRGWLILQALGHKAASVLEGGFNGWKTGGFPVSQVFEEPKQSVFQVNADAMRDVFVDKQEMLRAIHDHDIRILDIRDQDEWEGLSSSPYGPDFAPRKGRLERSVWLQWDKLMQDDTHYLTEGEIIAAMRQLGIKLHHTIYIYCFKGARAANTYIALRTAGFNNIKVYFGSWNEWSRDASLPIESDVLEIPASLA